MEKIDNEYYKKKIELMEKYYIKELDLLNQKNKSIEKLYLKSLKNNGEILDNENIFELNKFQCPICFRQLTTPQSYQRHYISCEKRNTNEYNEDEFNNNIEIKNKDLITDEEYNKFIEFEKKEICPDCDLYKGKGLMSHYSHVHKEKWNSIKEYEINKIKELYTPDDFIKRIENREYPTPFHKISLTKVYNSYSKKNWSSQKSIKECVFEMLAKNQNLILEEAKEKIPNLNETYFAKIKLSYLFERGS